MIKKRIKIFISRIISNIFFQYGKTTSNVNDHDRKDIIKNLEPLVLDQNLAEAELDWNKKVNELLDNFKEKNLIDFLSWNVIRKTMFLEYDPYIKHEFNYLKKNKIKLLKESSFGAPTRLYFYPFSSANLIHHQYHLARLLENFRIQINQIDYVLEFGGGYGSMARVFYKMGFNGKYTIYDFAAFNSIQKYYLRNVIFGNNTALEKCLTFYNEYDHLKDIDPKLCNKLFLATWSISETSLEFRNDFFNQLPHFQYYLIAFQHNFHDINNLDFFHKWSNESKSDIDWKFVDIEHIGQHSYLFGKRI